uniref:Uncharacterized protein n=1 Tax=Rhizophora mucronata TaxID=61149 RepID=A0A2P2PV52_RHIMU
MMFTTLSAQSNTIHFRYPTNTSFLP